MKIAVLGSGYAGLAVTWYLQQDKTKHVTVFEPNVLGGQASGVAAGLLHPYAGVHGKLNARGHDGMMATTELLDVASHALGTLIYSRCGLLRAAITDEQKLDFFKCSQLNDDVEWFDEEQCQMKIPGMVNAPGIFIKSALAVNGMQYLNGLWKACSELGMQCEKRAVGSLKELDDFDAVVIATGAGSRHFPELAHLYLRVNKGQICQVSWPKEVAPLSCAVNSQTYVVMHPSKKSCMVGATFERSFQTIEPTPEHAWKELYPKMVELLPFLKDEKLIDCKAALRVYTPSHKPIAEQVSDRIFVLTALGSKGLLHHALLAKELTAKIV